MPPVYPPGAPTTFAPATIQPDLVYPFPDAATNGGTANNQTFRSIIKPDLWGNTMRFRFSNTFGSQPVTFSAVTVGLQEYSGNVVDGTMTRVTFGGRRSVTIPVGQEIWSDATRLTWVDDADDPSLQGRNLAVSYAIAGDSGPMTFHSGANQTSFIPPRAAGITPPTSTSLPMSSPPPRGSSSTRPTSWRPPAPSWSAPLAISITDGTHTTFNINDRWSNVLSRRLHNAYGNRVSVVNEAIGGNRVVNPVVFPATSGQAATDRLNRDVLGLSGLTHVVWLEGINDLGGGHTVESIEAGYQSIVATLHAQGIKVMGATMTSALGMVNPAEGWYPGYTGSADNGPVVDANRMILNTYIRTSGLYDGVVDFDAATLDPSTGNMKAEYLPNSQFTQLPWDYLHPNHAGYTAMGEAIDLSFFASRYH